MLRSCTFDPLLLLCHILSMLSTFRFLSAIFDSKISISTLKLWWYAVAGLNVLTRIDH